MNTVIRAADPGDVPEVTRIVTDAYTPYIDRIGRAPAPMTVDYADLIDTTDHVYVATDDDVIVGVLVLVEKPDHVFVDSVAVSPHHHGRGLGRALLDVAEQRACDRGLAEIRLYTNAAMTENLSLYPYLGYTEVDRRVDDGFERVYFVKTLPPAP
ncbi:GNAT family N-acetyltransferase [Mycolicibacterium sp. 018/SC-01/001]|uniref:GNAT family N-acetyltransferase n=1 Tax=Mycolicibacterium sp. 018/SC-01/001 TaxID=2592069 RepID=UPI00117DBF0A|nr:GNAT family N-acetyltransferase [Mycolicibacterium sp. 018/SC-01/001]TRW77571.1 GNAT family N-acetyltransferase [Mycolicibacterium sp. 018/SC-01/001]